MTMTTDEFAGARRDIANDVALFLAFEDPEFASEFLEFWRDKLDRDITSLPPDKRSIFIWHMINDALARVHELERTAARGSEMLN
jgi:hypothetical protein